MLWFSIGADNWQYVEKWYQITPIKVENIHQWSRQHKFLHIECIKIWLRKIKEAMRTAYAKSGLQSQHISNYTRQTIMEGTQVLWKENAHHLRTTFQYFAESFWWWWRCFWNAPFVSLFCRYEFLYANLSSTCVRCTHPLRSQSDQWSIQNKALVLHLSWLLLKKRCLSSRDERTHTYILRKNTFASHPSSFGISFVCRVSRIFLHVSSSSTSTSCL